MPLARQSMPHDAAQTLAGIDFPADRSKIVEYARSKNASDDIIKALDGMPDDQYTSMADVFKGLGQSDS
ncbi:DUF2795 domain-containing protein [Magnetospirillum sp. UT-4]|uniref:DUF2795 domain-containing protein n=1 Tax=Magnetospirillum sp. UT-4 TaxID=2681467 RepID=UPI0013818ECD|nr:DUF2795 domain-containing protein [Magnetospirillum sp. UT-4]CAA7613564.1 conserved hypothetical protein [Magnetospirillum sp. UT-4]